MRTRRQMPALSDSESSTEENAGFATGTHFDWRPQDVDVLRTRRSAQAPSPTSDAFQLLCYAAVIVTLLGAALSAFTLALNVGIVTAGALNPAWQTFRALEALGPYASDDDDDREDQATALTLRRNWASYWVVMSALYTVERLIVRNTIGAFIPSPLYLALLFSAVVYLTHNNAEKSGVLYVDFARPALLDVDSSVEKLVQEAGQHLEYFMGMALVHFHEVIEPFAMRLRYAAARHARELQIQAEEALR